MGALPFCTSAPQWSRDSARVGLEEPVAPPMPSRPVRPPSRTMTSPGAGHSAADVRPGRCAHHRADLHALGHIAGVVHLIHLPGGQADLVAVGGVTGGAVVTSLRWGSLPGRVSLTG